MVNRRNSPCDCGSGKKHKRCCMKDPTKGAKQVNIKVNASMQELRRAVATVESELPQPKGIEASFDHLQRDLLAQHMPEQERNVVGSALRKSLSQGQPVNPENNVDTDIDFAMKGGTIHPSAKSKRVFSTPLPHVYKTSIASFLPIAKFHI